MGRGGDDQVPRSLRVSTALDASPCLYRANPKLPPPKRSQLPAGSSPQAGGPAARDPVLSRGHEKQQAARTSAEVRARSPLPCPHTHLQPLRFCKPCCCATPPFALQAARGAASTVGTTSHQLVAHYTLLGVQQGPH